VNKDPPELSLKIGPFSVSAKGHAAVRAIRWPVAFTIIVLVPFAVGLAFYSLFHIGMIRSLLGRWWP
jgi:hypothetical protein